MTLKAEIWRIPMEMGADEALYAAILPADATNTASGHNYSSGLREIRQPRLTYKFDKITALCMLAVRISEGFGDLERPHADWRDKLSRLRTWQPCNSQNIKLQLQSSYEFFNRD